MTKITGLDNCGNAPKQIVFADALIGYFTHDDDMVAANTDRDVEWKIIGQGSLEPGVEINSIDFEHILSHGKYASADGQVVTANGEELDFMAVGDFAGHAKDAKLSFVKTSLVQN